MWMIHKLKFLRHQGLKLIAILPLLLLLNACLGPSGQSTPTAIPSPLQTPTLEEETEEIMGTFISEQAAIDRAIQLTLQGGEHLSIALEPPKNPEAKLLRMTAARQKLIQQGWSDIGQYNPEIVVWVVMLDGSWTIDGGPLPDNNVATPVQFFHRAAVVLNASTGAFVNWTMLHSV